GLERSARVRLPEAFDAAAVTGRLTGQLVAIPVAPLIHGTAFFNSVNVLDSGGCLVILRSRTFDPVELLDAIQRERVKTIFIVGDVFSKPMVAALDAEPERWDISSLRVVASSGVMWSAESKRALLTHNPNLMLVDALGSSEAIGMARSVSTASTETEAATFTVSRGTLVIDDAGQPIAPGSPQRGRVALKGRAPIGYYKDPVKSAETFPVINGERYSVPGDWATVAADGTVNLLGRGSVCINTGGEKVFPEEVEEALKKHPWVADAVAVAVPDDRFGSAVWAVVEPAAGAAELDEAELVGHVKQLLAGYKAPKRILPVPSIDRGVNGKVDYRRWTTYAAEQRAGL
ncbi:MAG: Acyl-CoA synthetase, partial [Acidimicrobiia bacterium]|nr:Acyl-CoA synthetase [Acidimicrobiia bacterium]